MLQMGMIRKGTIGFQIRSGSATATPTIDTPAKLLNFARSNNIRILPLDTKALAEKLGIQVIYATDLKDEVSGILEKDENDRWIIRVNNKHHPNRQRYTIAHELGHYCLHKHQEKFFEDQTFFRGRGRTRTETQANRFASELLMPEDVFQRFLNEGVTDVETLAQRFGVSTLALRIRAKDLGYSESEI